MSKPKPKFRAKDYRSFHAADYAYNPAQGNKKPSLDYYDRRATKRERGA